MSKVPLPRAARGAVALAFLIAFVAGLSVIAGPIMLLGVCLAALLSAIGILRRRVWGAYGFAGLLILSMLVILFLAITGNAGTLLQTLISSIFYAGLAIIFLLAGHSLAQTGAKRGTPVPWIALLILFAAPFALYRPVSVSSDDMENTLLPGDFLLVDRSSAGPLTFGEMVAFHHPLDRGQILVRRVIGLPGDHIQWTPSTLYRNGVLVSEPYVTRNQSSGSRADVVVPPDKYFLLGDARGTARDSRNWGFVRRADIIGQAKFIYDSLAPDASDLKTADAKSGDSHQVSPTHPPIRRWGRIFELL
jgi:signal peptidase I